MQGSQQTIPSTQSHGKNFIIGDIQGCFDALQQVLAKAQFDPQHDCLWCVGDIVNRGGQSLQVLEFLYQLPHIKMVLGNHDIYLLLQWQHPKIKGAKEAELREILAHKKCDIWLEWLIQQPIMHQQMIGQQTHTMVHAGIPLIWNEQQALQKSQQLKQYILKDNQRIFSLWSNKPYKNKASHSTKKHMIYALNALTRMRHIRIDGKLDLSTTRRNHLLYPIYKPWFQYPLQLDCDFLYFGHWAAYKAKIGKDKSNCYINGKTKIYALDSGYVWGGALTVMNMETKETFTQANT